MNGDSILLVEDDKEIRQGVEIFLRSQGYQVFQAENGLEGLKLLEERPIDLAIVDVMMPVMDGYEAARAIRGSGRADAQSIPITMTAKLREKYDFPVIFLSAKTEEVDKILGLNIGADDYVTKPFTPMELMARVNSQLRRYHRFLDRLNSGQKENPKIHQVGGLEVNEETVEVNADGKNVKVTPIEFKILLLLIRNPGRVFPAEEIYERVWNERAINTDTVMVHIRNLREKIEVDPKDPKYIKVVWGVGYKLEKQ